MSQTNRRRTNFIHKKSSELSRRANKEWELEKETEINLKYL